MKLDAYLALMEQCGGRAEPLRDGARRHWLRKWRRFYAVGLHAATGRWKLAGFEWHVFSFEYTPALNGEAAIESYLAQCPEEIILCPEAKHLPAYRLTGARLPNLRPYREDIYVAPPDLSWTMAFTHEESLGLGPYFSCRPGQETATGVSRPVAQ